MCYRALPYPSLSPVLLPHISLTFKRLSSDSVRPRSMTPGPGEAGPAPAPRLVTGTLSTPGPSQCHSQLEARRQVQSEQSRGAHSTGCQEGGSVTVMMRPRQPRHSRHRGERQERWGRVVATSCEQYKLIILSSPVKTICRKEEI